MAGYRVSKAIITVEFEKSSQYLMSIKRDPGSGCEGKLEFLGGRHEIDEGPKQALLRELQEEETSGELARLATDRVNLFFTVTTAGAEHFLFPFQVYPTELERLLHCPVESFGFELVDPKVLGSPDPGLTYKTNAILDALNGQLDLSG